MKSTMLWTIQPTIYLLTASNHTVLNRRDFLTLTALGMGGFSFLLLTNYYDQPVFPNNGLLGRVNVGKVDVKALPDIDSPTVGELYENAVVPWLAEIVGSNAYQTIRRWCQCRSNG